MYFFFPLIYNHQFSPIFFDQEVSSQIMFFKIFTTDHQQNDFWTFAKCHSYCTIHLPSLTHYYTLKHQTTDQATPLPPDCEYQFIPPKLVVLGQCNLVVLQPTHSTSPYIYCTNRLVFLFTRPPNNLCEHLFGTHTRCTSNCVPALV